MTILDRSRATHVAGSTPYAWPWNGDLNPEGTAVLIVEPLGGGPVADSAVAAAVVEVVNAVEGAGGTVIRVRTARRPMAPQTVELPVEGSSTTIITTAAGLDGFFGSSLDALLRARGIDRLILVGSELETSVHSTMRSANDRGYECLLVIDACAAYDLALIAPSVSMIEMSGGIFGAVGTAAAVLDAFVAEPRGETK